MKSLTLGLAATAALVTGCSSAAATVHSTGNDSPGVTAESAHLAWKCGPTKKVFKGSSQTIQACIAAQGKNLYLKGLLGPTFSVQERLILILKDTKQKDHGVYWSPNCKKGAVCTLVVKVNPHPGTYTVLPQWRRFGKWMSDGHESPFATVR